MQDLQSSFDNRETIFQVTFSDLKVSGSEKIIWISAVRIIQTLKTSVRRIFFIKYDMAARENEAGEYENIYW